MSRSLSRLAVRARVLLLVAVAACALVALAGLAAPASGAITRARAVIPAIVNPRPVPIAYAGSQSAGYPFCADIVPVNPVTNAFGTPLIAPTGNCAATTSEAYAIAVSPNGLLGYVVTNQINSCANGYVVPVNLVSGQAYPPIPVGDMLSYNGQVPGGIAITPAGATAYVANFFGGTVTPVNLATQTAGTPIDLPGFNFPESIAIDPNGSVAYTADNQSGLVVPINLATNTPGAAQMLPGDSSQDVTFSPGWVNRSGVYLGNANVAPVFGRYQGALYTAFTRRA
jgi:DNA-binding beta-propeller fold protein YncE